MELIPPKLKAGDEVKIIAPSESIRLPFITEDIKREATKNLETLGLKVSFGNHINEYNEFRSATVEHRVEDLHEAFSDKNVKAILTVIGGFNSNELLTQINYDLIKQNPKILCGYSDITALQHAIYAKTGLVTYSGPHYFTFGVNQNTNYTESYFRKCLFEDKPFKVTPAEDVSEWSGSESRYLSYKNSGPWAIRTGKAKGKIIGANLCTLNLLQGTQFMPKIKNSILFIEDDDMTNTDAFARDLQSLFHLPGADTVRGLVLGRLQEGSKISRDLLSKILSTVVKKDIPILANADFGHTYPLITFPIGGKASLAVETDKTELKIIKH